MSSHIFSCKEAKQIDMVEYLRNLGHHPQSIRGADHWYLSPFRDEKTPSFKVNSRLNIWFDHGIGKGGNLVDFGMQFFNCSVKDFLQRLQEYLPASSLSFQQPVSHTHSLATQIPFAGEKKEQPEGKIQILNIRPLAEKSLLDYLQKRNIPAGIAERFCKEVEFSLYNKKYAAIGFENNAGGYELRSDHFKGSSSPKSITFVDNKTENVVVFEGFFNFLSFCTINQNKEAPLTNCLVLNSLSFFDKSRELMEKHKQVYLLLDNDPAGKNCTAKALEWNEKYIDRSHFYNNHKDLNEWLIQQNQHRQKECLRHGRTP